MKYKAVLYPSSLQNRGGESELSVGEGGTGYIKGERKREGEVCIRSEVDN